METGRRPTRRPLSPGERPGHVAVVVACLVTATAAFIAGRTSVTQAAAPSRSGRPAAVRETLSSAPDGRQSAGAGRTPTPDVVVRRTPSNDVDDDFLSPLVLDEKTNSIDVLLVVDRDDKDHAAVDAAVMRAVDAASAELDRQFGVKLHVTETQTLRFGEEPWDSDAAMEKLITRYTAPKGHLVLAFGPRPHTGDVGGQADWGVARPYGSHAMLFIEPGDAEWGHVNELLLHEIGHVLGAWHSAVPSSVMRARVWAGSMTTFDPVSAEVVGIGLASARRSKRPSSAEAFDRLSRICAGSPPVADGAAAPVIELLRWRAWDARRHGRTNVARRLMQRAMELAKIPGMCTPEQAKELEEGR